MACCAFAIFVLSQLLVPFRAARRWLGFKDRWRPDAAVEWRPGVPMVRRGPLRHWKLFLAATLAFDVAVLSILSVPAASADEQVAAQPANTLEVERLLHAAVCKPMGWRD